MASPSLRVGLVNTPHRALNSSNHPTRSLDERLYGFGGGASARRVTASGSATFKAEEDARAPTAPSSPTRFEDDSRSARQYAAKLKSSPRPAHAGDQTSHALTPHFSPAKTRRNVLEAEHEHELMKRQEVHQKLLRATEGRRDRAHAILDLHRTEIVQLEELVRLREAETQSLEAMRKDLSEALKRQEVVVYRTAKEAKVLRQETHACALTEKVHNKHVKDTSLVSTLVASTSPAGLFNFSLPHTSFGSSVAANAAAAFEVLTQRLEEARRVGDALERECLANEEALSNQRRERDAIKDLITVSEMRVKELEVEGPAALNALKSAQEKMRVATDYALFLPTLRQMVDDAATTLQLQKASSASTIRALMDSIKVDDEKLNKLRQAHGGSGASALQLHLSATHASPVRGLDTNTVYAAAGLSAHADTLGQIGAAFASSIIGKLATDLEAENAVYTAALAAIVNRAEDQRVRLQSTADALSSRVRFLEERSSKVTT